jgi:hypothetical protein
MSAVRSAPFSFGVDLAPYESGIAKFRLDWTGASDFDVFVFDDDEGFEIGRSAASNIDEGQTTFEEVEIPVTHCQRVTAYVRSFAGNPGEALTLKVSVTPGSKKLACAANDPAPGCAGKLAGEAPVLVPDTRTRLYLGGDPGQASMIHGLAAGTPLPQGRLEAARPAGGIPNQYTRPIAGFRDQFQNPFVPHWTTEFEQPRDINGDVQVLLWPQSGTGDATSTLYVDLFADGGLVGTVTVPGSALPKDAPAPLAVTIPNVDAQEAMSLTLQVATNPAAATSGPGNPGDAHVTLYYGSVQFPARITLP